MSNFATRESISIYRRAHIRELAARIITKAKFISSEADSASDKYYNRPFAPRLHFRWVKGIHDIKDEFDQLLAAVCEEAGCPGWVELDELLTHLDEKVSAAERAANELGRSYRSSMST